MSCQLLTSLPRLCSRRAGLARLPLCSCRHHSSVTGGKNAIRSKPGRLASSLKPTEKGRAQYQTTVLGGERKIFDKNQGPSRPSRPAPSFKPTEKTRPRSQSTFLGGDRKTFDHSRASKPAPSLRPTERTRTKSHVDVLGGDKKSFERDRAPHFVRQNPTSKAFTPNSLKAGETEKESRVALEEEEEIDAAEFYHPLDSVSLASDTKRRKVRSEPVQLPTTFSSPPLLPGFVTSLKELLGNSVKPTPIQSLSLKWIVESGLEEQQQNNWRQFLLASETGSGKSIAYLLPVLQYLKQSESTPLTSSNRAYNPRALVLAPTHELSRQLAGFAKSLLHHAKLRVVCASRANVKGSKDDSPGSSHAAKNSTASKLSMAIDEAMEILTGPGEIEVTQDMTISASAGRTEYPVDMLVGTPMKLLEMIRGRGWDRLEQKDDFEEDNDGRKLRRGRDKIPAIPGVKWRSKPELGLANVEWVIVDEADVLLDPDFQETTRTLLADISAARGKPVTVIPSSILSSPSLPPTFTPSPSDAIEYPFHLLLTSATIPTTLNAYLENHHPSLLRLASPGVHHLPKTLRTEYSAWTGGNKFADVERRLRQVWAQDDAARRAAGTIQETGLSKVLIFCNKSSKVIELARYLEENGIKSVPLTSRSEERARGSNRHLEGFLRKLGGKEPSSPSPSSVPSALKGKSEEVSKYPHVLLTTSLLSRGLDFSPDIQNVFIVDEPRNMVDFLHRAGRAGRAGYRGAVIIFGKMKGRGSDKSKEVRKRVGLLKQ